METPVRALLDDKGRQVITIGTGRTLADAAGSLVTAGIGALVVSDDGTSIDGILSERDIVRRLADHGSRALELTVGAAMTTPAVTCTADTTVGELMELMTERRFRHVPVVDGGALVGIVSIGDVVRSRISALERTSEQLQDYVTGGY